MRVLPQWARTARAQHLPATGLLAFALGSIATAQGPTIFPAPGYPTDGKCGGIAIVDMDGDGRRDLIAGNVDRDAVTILWGNDSGGFSPPFHVPAGWAPFSLAVADFNGDGRHDIVAASQLTDDLTILLNRGAGLFDPPVAHPLGGADLNGVTAAELNGDGRVDLVVFDHTSKVRTLLGDGHGGFTLHGSFPVGLQFYGGLDLADVNEDGALDLIAANAYHGFPTPILALLLGDGAGGFTPPKYIWLDYDAANLVVGDYDEDGHVDLLVALEYAGLQVLFGDGTGTFVAGPIQPMAWTGWVLSSDLNSDGHLDAIWQGLFLRVALGDGQGGFRRPDEYYFGPSLFAVGMADLDGDQNIDVVASASVEESIVVVYGKGGGALAVRLRHEVHNSLDPLAVGDLNGDRLPDLVTGTFFPTGVNVSIGVGHGHFGFDVHFPIPAKPGALALGDLDRDGDLDLVAATDDLPLRLWVLLGDGHGGFALAASALLPWAPTIGTCLAVGDASGDGLLDAVISGYYADRVALLLGDGSGGFGPASTFPTGAGPASVAIGDLNGDSEPDLLTANFESDDLTILWGDGLGGFGTSTAVPTLDGPLWAAIGDLNADGRSDIASLNHNSHEALLLIGDGVGGFTPSERAYAGKNPKAGALADLDGDGRLDVVAVGGLGLDLTVLFGDGRGRIASRTSYFVVDYPELAIPADVDLDGRTDLVTSSYSFPPAVLLNQGRPCVPAIYCTAKVNSLGCKPRIGFEGESSASKASEFTIRAARFLNREPGLLIYGWDGTASLPFKGGTLCVRPPFQRSPVLSSGGNPPPEHNCSGAYSLDLAALAASAGNPSLLLAPGTLVHCQWWGRDPGFAPPNDTSLSDGLSFTVCP